MSLKTTPKGLLAALAVLCILVLQLPLLHGQASAAQVRVSHAAAPTQHAASAVRPQVVKPHDITPITVTVAGVSEFPSAGPVGVAVTLTAPAATFPATTSVPITITDAGTVVSLGAVTSTATGALTFTGTIPITLTPGAATIAVSGTATLPFTVNSKTETLSSTSGTILCSTGVTLTLTNYAPGIPLTATLVYSTAGAITVTNPSLVTPTAQISTTPPSGPTGVGNFAGLISIPNSIPYGTQVTISLTAPSAITQSYPTTPTAASAPSATSGGFATFTIGARPALFVTLNPVNGVGTNATSMVGVTNTLSITSTTGFIPGSPISLTVGISGVFQTTLVPTSPTTPTADATGAFTATANFTPTQPGTYVVTATEGLSGTSPGCNVATGTFFVSVPAAPVSTSYFPEGYTGQGAVAFSETLSMLNPNPNSVIVTNTYLLETSNEDITTTASAPDVVVVTHTVAGLADVSFNVAADIGTQTVKSGPDAGKVVSGLNQKVATIVQTAGFNGVNTAVKGVAAERIITRMAGATPLDGDVSLGTTSANSSYYFAEGYTGSQFQEYLILLNPSSTVTATVTINRAPEGAASTLAPLGPYTLAPQQRLTLNLRRLNVDSPERAIGLIINSVAPDGSTPAPIAAERTEYFGTGNGSAKQGETIAAGLTTAAKQLNFAYNSVTGVSDTATTIPPMGAYAQTQDDRPFIEVVNPNIAGQVIAGTLSGSAAAPGPAAHVTIQLRGEDGKLEGFFTNDVDAGARWTLTDAALTSSSGGIGFPGVPSSAPTRAGVSSVVVSSSERVIAEEAQYFGQSPTTATGDANLGAPGLDLVGAPTGESDVFFPALSSALSQTVFLYNPGVNTTTINATYYGITGTVGHATYTIGADQIQVVGQGVTDSGGTGAAAGTGIPANTMGAEFNVVQTRGSFGGTTGEPGTAPETFVAAAVTHSTDNSNWWGTQGLYPLPTSCSTATGCP